jgi:hypothetical protein
LNRYLEYYTWSRWDEALFLSRVPERGQLCASENLASIQSSIIAIEEKIPDEDGQVIVSKPAASFFSSRPFIAYDRTSTKSPLRRFFSRILEILEFRLLWRSVRIAWINECYHEIPIRFIDGIFEWISTVFVLLFPFCLVFYVFMIFDCQPLQ